MPYWFGVRGQWDLVSYWRRHFLFSTGGEDLSRRDEEVAPRGGSLIASRSLRVSESEKPGFPLTNHSTHLEEAPLHQPALDLTGGLEGSWPKTRIGPEDWRIPGQRCAYARTTVQDGRAGWWKQRVTAARKFNRTPVDVIQGSCPRRWPATNGGPPRLSRPYDRASVAPNHSRHGPWIKSRDSVAFSPDNGAWMRGSGPFSKSSVFGAREPGSPRVGGPRLVLRQGWHLARHH